MAYHSRAYIRRQALAGNIPFRSPPPVSQSQVNAVCGALRVARAEMRRLTARVVALESALVARATVYSPSPEVVKTASPSLLVVPFRDPDVGGHRSYPAALSHYWEPGSACTSRFPRLPPMDYDDVVVSIWHTVRVYCPLDPPTDGQLIRACLSTGIPYKDFLWLFAKGVES
jgi:hypothetical protein